MSRRRVGLGPIAILVAVFVLGGAAGAAVTWAVAVRDLRATMENPRDDARAKFRLEAMRRHLDLDDTQVDKLEVILENASREKDAAIEGCRPALDELRSRTAAQIDEVLTPEQQKKHAEMRQRMRERFRGHKSGAHAPSGSRSATPTESSPPGASAAVSPP